MIIFRILSILGLSVMMAIWAADSSGSCENQDPPPEDDSDCEEEPDHPSCDPCKAADPPPECGCDCNESQSCSQSTIDNLRLEFMHSAWDYRLPVHQGQEGTCTSCGGSRAFNADSVLSDVYHGALEVERILRPRQEWHFPCTFGRGCFAPWDLSLRVFATDYIKNDETAGGDGHWPMIILFDPRVNGNHMRFFWEPFGRNSTRSEIEDPGLPLWVLQQDTTVQKNGETRSVAGLQVHEADTLYDFGEFRTDSGPYASATARLKTEDGGYLRDEETKVGWACLFATNYDPNSGSNPPGMPGQVSPSATVTTVTASGGSTQQTTSIGRPAIPSPAPIEVPHFQRIDLLKSDLRDHGDMSDYHIEIELRSGDPSAIGTCWWTFRAVKKEVDPSALIWQAASIDLGGMNFELFHQHKVKAELQLSYSLYEEEVQDVVQKASYYVDAIVQPAGDGDQQNYSIRVTLPELRIAVDPDLEDEDVIEDIVLPEQEVVLGIDLAENERMTYDINLNVADFIVPEGLELIVDDDHHLLRVSGKCSPSVLARPLSIRHHGSEWFLDYVHDVDASMEDVEYDTRRLYHISTVTDQFGSQIQLEYELPGQDWGVDTIQVPTGGLIDYHYSSGGFNRLEKIDHADGATSTFDYISKWQSDDQTYRIIIFDNGAERPFERAKMIGMTYHNYNDGQEISWQPAYQPRYVNKGQSGVIPAEFEETAAEDDAGPVYQDSYEVSYRNWLFDNNLTKYVYEGGHRLKRLEQSSDWLLLESAWRALDLNFDPQECAQVGLDIPEFTSLDWVVKEKRDISALHGMYVGFEDGLERKWTRQWLGVTSIGVIYPGGKRQVGLDVYGKVRYAIENDRLFEYAFLGGKQLIKKKQGAPGQLEYDEFGYLTSATFDAAQPISLEEWDYKSTVYGLRLLSHKAPGGRTTDYVYDEQAGVLLEVQLPADDQESTRPVHTFEYDVVGRVSARVDPDGRRQEYTYDVSNRLVRVDYADDTFEVFIYGGFEERPDWDALLTSHTDRNGNETRYEYDWQLRKSGVRSYDPAGALLRVEEYEYLSGTELVSARILDGERIEYLYDYDNRRVATKYYAGTGTVLEESKVLDIADRVLYRTDRYGRRTFYLYDINKNVTREVRELIVDGLTLSEDQAEREMALVDLSRDANDNPAYVIIDTVYDVWDRVLSRLDENGMKTKYEYDVLDRRTAMIEAVGTSDERRREYDYDDAGNVIEIRHPRHFDDTETGDFITRQTWTGRSLLESRTVALDTDDEATETFRYTLTGKKAEHTDFGGFVTKYGYGSCCDRLEQIEDPLGNLTQFVYDGNGNLIARTDPNLLTTFFSYDGLDRRVSTTNPLIQKTLAFYDADLFDDVGIGAIPVVADLLSQLPLDPEQGTGSAMATQDPTGAMRISLRDGLGREIAAIDPEGHATTMAYDLISEGLVEESVTDALGHIQRRRRDAAGRIRWQQDAASEVTTLAYDGRGRLRRQRDPSGVGVDITYDDLGRAVSRVDTVGAEVTTSYDAHDNVLSITDALQHSSESSYDARDRKVTETDRIAAITVFGYDAGSNLLNITDAEGGVTTYAYDKRGLLTEEQFPAGDAGTTLRRYDYDAGGRLVARTVGTVEDPELVETTTYTYDDANRLLSRRYVESGYQDAFSYDDAGRLLTADSGRYGTSVDRSYAPGGQLATETMEVDGQSYPVDYSYDDLGRLSGLTYPDGAEVIRAYDDRSLLSGLQVTADGVTYPLVEQDYDASGRLLERRNQNGLTETRTYKTGSHLVEVIQVPGVTDFQYVYNDNQWKTDEIDNLDSAWNQEFGYDDAGRLTSWNLDGRANQTWDLSLVGDWDATTRTGEAAFGELRQHEPVHELTNIERDGASRALAYDFKGNLLTARDDLVYEWDEENRLITAKEPGAGWLEDDVTSGLRLRASFEEGIGTTTTGFAADGQPVVGLATGPLDWINGASGTGIYLDQMLEGFEFQFIEPLPAGQVLSCAIWMRLDDPGLDGYSRLFSSKEVWDQSDGFEIEVNPLAGELTFVGAGSTRVVAEGIDWDFDWHHVAAVVEQGRVQLYLDGQALSMTNDQVDMPYATGGGIVRVGENLAGSGQFIGALDEVRIYDRALSPSTIGALAGGLQRPVPAVVAHWSLDGDGFDQGPQHVNGIVEGGAAFANDAARGVHLICDGGGRLAIPDNEAWDDAGSFAVTVWARADDPSLAGPRRLLSHKNAWDAAGGWELAYDAAAQRLQFIGAGGAIAQEESVDLTGGWHHVTASVSGGRVTFCIDGVQRFGGDWVGQIADGSEQLAIGSMPPGWLGWVGGIDDVRLYPVALDAAQVQAIMNENVSDYNDQFDAMGLQGEYHGYRYDALGRRAQKFSAAGSVTYAMAGAQVVQEYEDHQLARSFVYGSYVDEPLVMVNAAGEFAWYHSNHLYSVAAMTDSSGSVVERYGYDAYGKRTVLNADGSEKTTAAVQPYGFTGRRLDDETGLWYFRARYFDSGLGRFIGKDDYLMSRVVLYQHSGDSWFASQLLSSVFLGYPDGWNLYAGYFVPLHMDPYGHDCCNGTTKYDPDTECCTPDGVEDKVENALGVLVCDGDECPEGQEKIEGEIPAVNVTGIGSAKACKEVALVMYNSGCDASPCASNCRNAAAAAERDCTNKGEQGPWTFNCCVDKKE